MKALKLFTLTMILGFFLSGCEGESKNYLPENIKEKEIKDKTYYMMVDEKEYDGEYHIDEIYSINFDNTRTSEIKENETSPDGIVYDYYNFKDKGEIMTYYEYVNYCKSYKIEPYYSDEESNYLIVSYGSDSGWMDVILSAVVTTDEKIDVYIWDDIYGVMADGSGYILTIPTKLSKDAEINVIPCITKEEYINLKTYGYIYNPKEITCDKPVIYLYPEEKTDIEVKLDIDGELTCTYPLYKDSWNITAMPDGTLYDENGLEYKYLFWEAKTNKKWKFDEGFCIKGSETLEFFEEILPKLGLNRDEANDFITYWLPQMQNNKYNIISFQTSDYTDNFKLITSPAADTTIRVFMTWKSSDDKINIKEQKITTPERNGFTVVEWGGSHIE